MAKVDLSMLMEMCMKEIGLKIKQMVKEYTRTLMVLVMKVTGKKNCRRGMVLKFEVMGVGMKDFINVDKSMDLEHTDEMMELFIQANGLIIK